jgi:beta-1,4-mannooligosaccharide/beta-1,4-mannosyl-N-acetylglucosamine phosphorylase
VALLDLDEPWKVIARGHDYVLSPQRPYEQVGDVQNVLFPCAALTEGDRISVYYGAADTVTCLAHGTISDLIAFARER